VYLRSDQLTGRCHEQRQRVDFATRCTVPWAGTLSPPIGLIKAPCVEIVANNIDPNIRRGVHFNQAMHPPFSIETVCKAMLSSTSTTVRIVSQKEQSTLSKAQKAFNKLIDKIGKQRKTLADWQATIPLYQQKYDSKFRPLVEIFNQRRGELVHALDRAYDDKALNKSDRARISDIICAIAAELIADDSDETLKPIYNKHSNTDFDAEAEDENKAIKSMMESMLGIDLGDELDFSSPEKVFVEVDQQLKRKVLEEEQRQQANKERRSKRKKSAKQLDKEARLRTEEENVSQSIREVFRKLASALHPDREQDPVEHQRKTALMQKVNVAYGNRDLLQLLELQLELEQIDQNAMSAVSEERLKHYNKVLAEQSSELQQEIDMITFSFKAKYEFSPGDALSPSMVMALLQKDIREIQQDIADVKQDIASCENIKSLKRLLKAFQASQEALFEGNFLDEMNLDILFKRK